MFVLLFCSDLTVIIRLNILHSAFDCSCIFTCNVPRWR